MSRYRGKYFSIARIAASVHSAVEILCAPRALQMVTCGPTTAESTPSPPSSTAPASRRAGAATRAWPASDKDPESTHRCRRRDPFCPTRGISSIPSGKSRSKFAEDTLGIRRVASGSSPTGRGLSLSVSYGTQSHQQQRALLPHPLAPLPHSHPQNVRQFNRRLHPCA